MHSNYNHSCSTWITNDNDANCQ